MRRIDEFGFMHVDSSNISKEQVRPYLGSEINRIAEAASIPVDLERRYYVYCPADELAKSVGLWNGQQLKLDHAYGDAIDPGDNWIGSVYDAEFEAPYLKARLSINDKEAQDLLETGEYKELSASYLFDLVSKPGVFDGVKYDFIMSNIRPNHVAMVPKGRAGKECCVTDNNLNENKGVKFMEFIDKLMGFLQAMKEGGGDGEPTITDEPPETDPVVVVEPDEPAADEDNTEAIIAAIEAIDPGMAEKLRAALSAGPTVGDEMDPELDKEPIGDQTEPEPDKQPAMDAALVEKNVTEKIKALYVAARKVKPIVGDVDPFAYTSPDDIYALALVKKGYDPKKYNRAAWQGMAEMAVSDSATQWKPVAKNVGYDKNIFPHVAKKGV